MESVNTDMLIPLVYERKVLWDKTSEIYKSKTLTNTAWREIFIKLHPNFAGLTQKEKQEFSKVVVKRWTNVRDSWMKYYKKQNSPKAKKSKKFQRPYIYYRELSFLKKLADPNAPRDYPENVQTFPKRTNTPDPLELIRVKSVKPDSGADHFQLDDVSQQSLLPLNSEDTDKMLKIVTDAIVDPDMDLTSSYSLEPKVKKHKTEHINSAVVEFLYTRMKSDDTNRHLSFFRGILPSLETFSDENTLEFQAGVLSLIQTVKRKQQQQFNNPTLTNLSLNSPIADCQYRPGFTDQQSQQILNQSIDSLPSTSGYFGSSHILDPSIPSPASSSAEESSTEFNFEDEDF